MDERLFPDQETPAPPEAAKEVPETPSFEEAIAQLETLVRQMETGQLPLDKLISAYEKGGKLARFCRAQLDTLERKIQILSENAPEGAKWDDFSPGEGR